MTFKSLLTLAIPILLGQNPVVAAPTTTTAEEYSPLADKYIKEYYTLAVAEMERTSIPASITLAQGMLESGYGTSELAISANNHFGIKCHKGWQGETYTYHSPENDNGTSISRKSCFRAYATVEASYQDHSDFLASRAHYADLFASQDYEKWAKGLLAAGYATDPNYAKKLIATIATYKLGKYDTHANTITAFNNSTEEVEYRETLAELKSRIQTLESILSQSEMHRAELDECLNAKRQELANLEAKHDQLKEQLNEKITILDNNLSVQYTLIDGLQKRLQRVENIQQDMLKSDPLIGYFNVDGTPKEQVKIFPTRQLNQDGIFYQSGRRATIATGDRNLLEIAREYNILFKDLLRYNDLEDDADLPAGYYVYIEPKANYVKNQTEPHQVVIGETVHTISQRYGIKASKIYQRNHLKKGEEPASGEFIFLNKVNDEQPRLNGNSNTKANFGGGGARQR